MTTEDSQNDYTGTFRMTTPRSETRAVAKIKQRAADTLGCSIEHFNRILIGRRSAGKKLAVEMGRLLDTRPELWVFGSRDERMEAFESCLKRKMKAEGARHGRTAQPDDCPSI